MYVCIQSCTRDTGTSGSSREIIVDMTHTHTTYTHTYIHTHTCIQSYIRDTRTSGSSREIIVDMGRDMPPVKIMLSMVREDFRKPFYGGKMRACMHIHTYTFKYLCACMHIHTYTFKYLCACSICM